MSDCVTIVCMIFLVGPEFEPLPLQQDLLVGLGFNSLALIAWFRPTVSLAYVKECTNNQDTIEMHKVIA